MIMAKKNLPKDPPFDPQHPDKVWSISFRLTPEEADALESYLAAQPFRMKAPTVTKTLLFDFLKKEGHPVRGG
jgi:hypothetical protein